MLTDLCFKITVAAGWERGCWGENGSREAREEGSQKARRTRMGAKEDMRSCHSHVEY